MRYPKKLEADIYSKDGALFFASTSTETIRIALSFVVMEDRHTSLLTLPIMQIK